MTQRSRGLRPHRPGGRAHRRRQRHRQGHRARRWPAPAPRSSAATSTRQRCRPRPTRSPPPAEPRAAVATDVTPRAQVDALVDGAQAEFGRVDIMGNIAGHPAQQDVHGGHRRGLRAHPLDQPEELRLRLPGRDAGHGAARVRQHHQHLVGRDRHARADPRLLRHDQGRGGDAHQDARLRGRAARDPGQRPRSRA